MLRLARKMLHWRETDSAETMNQEAKFFTACSAAATVGLRAILGGGILLGTVKLSDWFGEDDEWSAAAKPVMSKVGRHMVKAGCATLAATLAIVKMISTAERSVIKLTLS